MCKKIFSLIEANEKWGHIQQIIPKCHPKSRLVVAMADNKKKTILLACAVCEREITTIRTRRKKK